MQNLIILIINLAIFILIFGLLLFILSESNKTVERLSDTAEFSTTGTLNTVGLQEIETVKYNSDGIIQTAIFNVDGEIVSSESTPLGEQLIQRQIAQQEEAKRKTGDSSARLAELTQDPLFSTLIFYSNDPDIDKIGQKTGLEKCMDKCEGTCLEFGMTSNAFCFPRNKDIKTYLEPIPIHTPNEFCNV